MSYEYLESLSITILEAIFDYSVDFLDFLFTPITINILNISVTPFTLAFSFLLGTTLAYGIIKFFIPIS